MCAGTGYQEDTCHKADRSLTYQPCVLYIYYLCGTKWLHKGKTALYFREFVLLLCLYQGNDACREYVRLERSLLLFFAKSYEYIIVISYVAKSFFKSIQIPLCDVSNNFRYINAPWSLSHMARLVSSAKILRVLSNTRPELSK